MSKKVFIISTVLLLIVWGTSFTKIGSSPRINDLPKVIVVPSPALSSGRAACSIQKHNDTAVSFYSGWNTGDRFVTYFDIEVECGSPGYPFEMQSISFLLYDPGTFQWPVNIDVVVFEMAGTDSCDGPGDELCRFSVTCDEATFGIPNIGTVEFPTPCCVKGPVFIGLEYMDDGAGPYPSIMFDNSAPVPECDNWAFGPSVWEEWFDYWSSPEPGYPIFWVDGESQSTGCDSSVVVNEVRTQPFEAIQNSGTYTYAFVELYNAGGYVIDIEDWGLTDIDGNILVTFPQIILAPGDFLEVYFGNGLNDIDLSDGVGVVYTNGDSVVFDSAYDGAVLYTDPNNSSTILDAVFWSTDGTTPSGSSMSDAVSAGIWSSGDYFENDSLEAFSSYGLCPDGADHNDGTDWRLFGWGEYHLSWANPQNPIQLTPPHGGLLDDYSSELSWGDRPFADSFQVQIDNSPSFTSPEISATTNSTSYSVAGLTDGYYYWRVRVFEGGVLQSTFASYDLIADPAAKSGAPRTSVQLGVTHQIQHKDTKILCIYDHRNSFRPGCEEAAGTTGPWDATHATGSAHVVGCEHCQMYCTRAVISMINNFYGGDLTQDRISYELYFGNNPGPEADLGHWQGTGLGSSGGAHGIGRRWQIFEWALGTTVTRVAGKPSFAAIQASIDAGHPIYIDGQDHATLVYGYYFENLQGSPTPAVYIHNPWPGTAGFSSYAAWQPDGSGWGHAGYFVIPPAYDPASAIDQESGVTTDTDGDGVMDFDEQDVRNFHSVKNDVDTDDDEVNDKQEIKNYTHHDRATYHPGHDNNPLDFPDLDNDGLRAENDCDSDNDSDFDGGEDIDGDGHNPVPDAGNVCDRETCQFDAGEFCIKVAVDKDTYLLGEPVYLVDQHYTRETHTYHSNSTYNYELGNNCPTKADGSALAHNGSFNTNAGGHAIRKRVDYCLFPGQRYLTVDVLDDNIYSTPDNLDPQTCWTCANDWFHGFHWAYDYAVHNPSFPYPTWTFPSICIFEGSDPTIATYVVECPWWWWCYSWPPVLDNYWIAIEIDRPLISNGQVSISTPPALVQGSATCGSGPTVNTYSFDELLTSSLEDGTTDTSKQWLAFSIQNWQLPDSLLSTRFYLDIPIGTKLDANPYVKIMAGDAVYGWSPTPYDSIPITIISSCCVGIRGDLNGDGIDANILDLTYAVDRIFRGGPPAACPEEGDVNSDGDPTNILDLTFLVDRIFRGGPLPGSC